MGSIIALPNDYVVVDLETTGLDSKYDDIIEISAVRFRNGIEIDSFNQLISIDYPIPCSISHLTGITNDMLCGCPKIEQAILDFSDYIGTDMIIGHNISFDIHFLAFAYKLYLAKDITNPYIDTMRIARKIHPEWAHHRLCDLANYYCIPYEGAHRAREDCIITNKCYRSMRDVILSRESEDDFKNRFVSKSGFRSHQFEKSPRITDMKPQNIEIDKTNPLFQKNIVFTGTLKFLSREEAMQIAIDKGAVIKSAVSRNTDILVVGKQDISIVGLDGMSTKEEKAHEINRSGKGHITIISEDDFLGLVQPGGLFIIC